MKRKITAVFCLVSTAAAFGMTSCTDVDMEEFYLDSIPESITSAEQTDSAPEQSDSPADTTAGSTEDAEEEKDTVSPDPEVTQNGLTSSPDEQSQDIIELSEAETNDSAVSAEPLVDSDSSAPDGLESIRTIGSVYTAMVDDYAVQCEKDPLYKPEFCKYYIFDIDSDGTPELLAEIGSCEADRTVCVYGFDEDSGKAVEYGNFVAWHAQLGVYEGQLACETKAMGSYLLTTVELKDSAVSADRSGTPTDSSALEEVLPSYPFTDLSGLEGI